MLKFRRFRASLKFGSKNHKETLDSSYSLTNVSVSGEYRKKGEEFFGVTSHSEQTHKKIDPAMVRLPPPFDPEPSLRPTKSTADLTALNKLPPELRKSTPEVSMNPQGSTEQVEKKNSRKKKTDKKSDKKKKDKKPKETKSKAPKPPPMPTQRVNPLSQVANTNTLASTISKTSGPPPYDDVPDKLEVIPNNKDQTGNTSFGKPVEVSSWDLVSQHREQVSRPMPQARKKQTLLDMNFTLHDANRKDDNSEA